MHMNKCKSIISNNLAVFDLDGTLYKCNSHIEVLNQKYKGRVFDSFIVRAVGKIFNKSYLKLLYYFYKKIPVEFIRNFNPEFRKSALELLKQKKREGYCVVIVSNAPKKLIETAAKRLNVAWLQAEIGHKSEVVIKNYNYKNLFVCTDNISDMNLLDIANERVIYVTKKNKRAFCEKYPHACILEA